MRNNMYHTQHQKGEKKYVTIAMLLIFALIIMSAVQATSITATVPSTLNLGDAAIVPITLSTSAKINGSLEFSYANAHGQSSFAFTEGFFTGTGPFTITNLLVIQGIQPGSYTVNVVAKQSNEQGTLDIGFATGSGTVLNPAPTIVSKSPLGIITQKSFVLYVETDQDANCKYNSLNTSYDQMPATCSHYMT